MNRGDTHAMSGRLLKLLAEPDLRKRLGTAGLEVVARKFDLRQNVAQLIASYGI